MTKRLSIVMPARNEEKIIVKTLELLYRKVNIPHEIIVVNDGSSDQTEKVVREYIRRFRNVKLVSTAKRHCGFAAALEKGISMSSKDYLVIVMADLCDEPGTINKMYAKMQEGWDVVCGSRYMRGGRKIGGPKLQGWMSEFVCRSLKLLVGVPTSDVSNAFKMYRRDLLSQIRINPTSGVEGSMEMLLQGYFQGARITEVPTKWVGRTVGKSKFKIVKRVPRYLRIYLWALENSLRKSLNMSLRPFYA